MNCEIMFEKFYITIISEVFSDLSILIDEFQIKPHLFVTADEWGWEKQTEIDRSMIKSIKTLAENGTIVCVEGTCRDVNCGLYFFKTRDEKYRCELWFSADSVDGLTENGITDKNKYVYDLITALIKEYCDCSRLVLCAMGINAHVGRSKDVNVMIERSFDVARWLLPANESIDDERYTEELDGGLKMYSVYVR